MKQPLLGLGVLVLLIAISSSIVYVFLTGAAWVFFVWFASSDIAISVFLGTLTTLAFVAYVVTQGKVRP